MPLDKALMVIFGRLFLEEFFLDIAIRFFHRRHQLLMSICVVVIFVPNSRKMGSGDRQRVMAVYLDVNL